LPYAKIKEKKEQSKMSNKRTEYECVYPFTAETYLLIGKKARAVYFGEERVEVKNWREVFQLILTRCNEQKHDRLMYLRDKVAGKVRTFISATPDGMERPFQLDEGLFLDSGHYGTATLLHRLRDCILTPACYDYSNIIIAVIKN
jgi:hypothetical protein